MERATDSELSLYRHRLGAAGEIAVWAADWKGLPIHTHSYLPGLPSRPTWRRHADRGAILLRQGRPLSDAAVILDVLERHTPTPALYPADYRQRQSVLAWQTWALLTLAPTIHVAFFHDLLRDSAYAAPALARDCSPWLRAAYHRSFPLWRARMRRREGINAASARESRVRLREALDQLAGAVPMDQCLVGEHFTAADLTLAAVLAPTCLPTAYPDTPSQPLSPGVRRWRSLWQDHPATNWVTGTYARYRHANQASS